MIFFCRRKLLKFSSQCLLQVKLLEQLYTQLMQSAQTKDDPMARSTIDPALPIHEQVENLPYDIRYEIPRDRLTLGGFFGLIHVGFV